MCKSFHVFTQKMSIFVGVISPKECEFLFKPPNLLIIAHACVNKYVPLQSNLKTLKKNLVL